MDIKSKIGHGINRIAGLMDLQIIKRSKIMSQNEDLMELCGYYFHNINNIETSYNYQTIKTKVLSYLETLRVSKKSMEFLYSSSQSIPCVYGSVYAVMIMSLFGEIKSLTTDEKSKWKRYFDSFQCEDGLFRDERIANESYEICDWWGARHIALHMIMVYNAINAKPKYPFHFLNYYKKESAIRNWLDNLDWDYLDKPNDVDNHIMNIGTLLQFSRDVFSDQRAGSAVESLKKELLKRIDPDTGLWAESKDLEDRASLSRAVQFAYHLIPLFLFDLDYFFNTQSIVEYALKTQNSLGGYSPNLYSTACEDIDSIYLLIQFSQQFEHRQTIVHSIQKSLPWILANMNEDGGFVFQRNTAFTYGHKIMSSNKNESALFPTWFRVLSLAFIDRFSGFQNYNINHCPGLEFINIA